MSSNRCSPLPIYVKVIIAGTIFVLVIGGLIYLFMSRQRQDKESTLAIPMAPPPPGAITRNMTNMEFSESLLSFSFNFFDQMRQMHLENNLIISPLSIETCLAMVRMGAEGETAAEIDVALNTTGYSADSLADNFLVFLSNYKDSDYLHMANKIYVNINYELQQNFTDVVTRKFLAYAEAIDFSQANQAADDINMWVDSKTNHLISNIVVPDMFNNDTMTVLLSAIHFQDEWRTQFDGGDGTKEADFYIDDSKTVKVQMMHKLDVFGYDRFPELDANMVRLPYKNSNFSMVILLPNTRTGLHKTLENLQKNYTAVIEKMKLSINTNVDVYLPKFKAEFEVELNESLQKMGMKQAFYNGEFQKMLKTARPLSISQVVHKAFIDVDEVGTKAAAATGAVTEGRSLAQGHPMTCDHPFFYMIVDSNFIPLFKGVVAKF